MNKNQTLEKNQRLMSVANWVGVVAQTGLICWYAVTGSRIPLVFMFSYGLLAGQLLRFYNNKVWIPLTKMLVDRLSKDGKRL